MASLDALGGKPKLKTNGRNDDTKAFAEAAKACTPEELKVLFNPNVDLTDPEIVANFGLNNNLKEFKDVAEMIQSSPEKQDNQIANSVASQQQANLLANQAIADSNARGSDSVAIRRVNAEVVAKVAEATGNATLSSQASKESKAVESNARAGSGTVGQEQDPDSVIGQFSGQLKNTTEKGGFADKLTQSRDNSKNNSFEPGM